MASGASGRGKRGRVKARVYVIRRMGQRGVVYGGKPTSYDAHPTTAEAGGAEEFATAYEAREEIGVRCILGLAREGTWKVYRRGRREEGVQVDAREHFHAIRELRELRAEVAHLREQRDHLQTTNTRLVEERRALKAELEARLAAGRSGEAA